MKITKRPILVTGAHRTGTTWVGKMLAANPQIAYIDEPLNAVHRLGVFDVKLPHFYTYICQENEAEYLAAFTDLLKFRYHYASEVAELRSLKDFLRMWRDSGSFLRSAILSKRALLKDPFAVFSLPWFAERLDCQIVVTMRHPAGFASSLKRLNWIFDFKNLLSQPLLMRDHFAPYCEEMQSMPADDVIGQASLLWTMIYGFVHNITQQLPSIQLVRHEDLSLEPLEGFRRLYNELGIQFTPAVERTILDSSSSDNPTELSVKKMKSVKLNSRANLDNWRHRLSPEEIARVLRITEKVAGIYYPETNGQ